MAEVPTIPVALASKYMRIKKHYNALSQALKIARLYDKPELIEVLSLRRSVSNEDRMKCEEEVIRKMSKECNLVHITGNWVGIRFLDGKGKTAFKDDIIPERDLYLIKRNPKRENNLRYTDLDTLLPGIIDMTALAEFKKIIQDDAYVMLSELGFNPESEMHPESAGDDMSVPSECSDDVVEPVPLLHASTHACKRWVERVYKIFNESKVAEYVKQNRDKIEKEIENGYNSAQQVWAGEDGVRYWFDDNNMMYLIGDNPSGVGETVITLYEEDFGFTKEINRMITFKQLEVLKQSYDELVHEGDIHAQLVESLGHSISGIDGQLNVLRAQISYLEAERASLIQNTETSARQVELKRGKYAQESGKLFKKW